MAQQYYWTIDEITDLIKHWPNTPTYSTNKRNIFKCNSKAKDLSLTKSYNALIIEAKTKSNKCKWCNIEDEILTNEWPYVLNYSFGNRSIGSCNDRAIKLGLVKMKEIQDEVDYNERIRKENVYKKRVEIVVYRNKNILGRNLSNEELKIIASKYKTKQEFKFYDYFSSVGIPKYDGFTNVDEILSDECSIENLFLHNKDFSLIHSNLQTIQEKLIKAFPLIKM